MNLRFVALAALLILLPSAGALTSIWFGQWIDAVVFGIILVYGLYKVVTTIINDLVEQDMKRWP